MSKRSTIQVQGKEISLLHKGEQEDFISLTDMVRGLEGEPTDYVRNWLRNTSTVQFLGVWEKVHNPSFNLVEFHQIKTELIDNTFLMSVKKWLERTDAIGIEARAGRYGGTYAHNEIALQFATWLSPEFHVYLVKEFKRLKEEEVQRKHDALEWDVRRLMSRVNYRIHTDAIKATLIPQRVYRQAAMEGVVFASEADVLNMALFGMTAKTWRLSNPNLKGNMRDYATANQLLVLANLESHNAEFLREDLAQDERLQRLNEIAIYQMEILEKEGLPDKFKE